MDVNLLHLQEAIASVALSHPEECDCYICKAATGDTEAFARVLEDIEHLNQEEPHDGNRVLNA